MKNLMQALDMYGAEAGIELSSLLLKINEKLKFENFSTSMCTLIWLFQWSNWNAVGHRAD